MRGRRSAALSDCCTRECRLWPYAGVGDDQPDAMEAATLEVLGERAPARLVLRGAFADVYEVSDLIWLAIPNLDAGPQPCRGGAE